LVKTFLEKAREYKAKRVVFDCVNGNITKLILTHNYNANLHPTSGIKFF